MANYYNDINEIKFELENSPLMERIVELKERQYEDKDKYDEAPQDFADAMDSYDKVLDIVGDIVANVVAPNAEAVDAEGPHLEKGRVTYASKTYENLNAMIQAGMNGYMAATLAGLVEGVVVFEYAMAHYNWSRWASTIFLIMIFMNGLLFQILAIAGILDTVFDYRKKFFGAER